MDLIFEANLINLTILVGGLFKLLSDALSESLSERQQKILEAIQESEEKLQEAEARWNQQLQEETKRAKKELANMKEDIEHIKANYLVSDV